MSTKTKVKLPVGIESFDEIRTEGFYYIDKTNLIRDLLNGWGKVNLFTRPRRFGKSLNMSMLKSFFETGTDKRIFDGLSICKETVMCEQYMGKYPVISVSFKGIQGEDFNTARNVVVDIINEEARRFQSLNNSKKLSRTDKAAFSALMNANMNDSELYTSLKRFSEFLRKHYDQKVIILIDEYDVPLAKAQQKGYYDQMVMLIRNIFEHALKSNNSLYFAVLTGCLRVSKESIFTGLNNMKIFSITNVKCDEYFGFTDYEVKELLKYYDLSEHYDTAKEWYNGYRFGDTDVYCPWDVINYVDDLYADSEAEPDEYWMHTSGNDIIRKFLEKSKLVTVKHQIERLMEGEVIARNVKEKLTYKEMYDSIENIWSVLFMTGYLTQKGKAKGRTMLLAIPNAEIRNIFSEEIMAYFLDSQQEDGNNLNILCDALKSGDAKKAEEQFQGYLNRIISIRDTAVQKDDKENFYHGMLLGILGFKETWGVSSNRESGDGYADVLIEIEEGDRDSKTGIVIEIKYSETENMDSALNNALKQIEEKNYAGQLISNGCSTIIKYGIACHKKKCKVVLGA